MIGFKTGLNPILDTCVFQPVVKATIAGTIFHFGRSIVNVAPSQGEIIVLASLICEKNFSNFYLFYPSRFTESALTVKTKKTINNFVKNFSLYIPYIIASTAGLSIPSTFAILAVHNVSISIFRTFEKQGTFSIMDFV